jgi:hypothetical protein
MAKATMANALRRQRQAHFEGKGSTMAKAPRWQRPRWQRLFEGKGKAMAKARQWQRQGQFEGVAKVLRCERQGQFEGKDPTMAKVTTVANALPRQRPFDCNGKRGTLMVKALRRQTPFGSKGPSMVNGTLKAKAVRMQRQRLSEGKV